MFNYLEASERNLSRASVDIANEGIEKIRRRLADRIVVSVIPGFMIKALTQAFFQGHIRRSLMQIEGGYDAYRAGNGLVAHLCVRAIIENVACVLDYCDHLTDHLTEDNFQKTAQFLYARVYAASMDGFAEEVDGFNNKAGRIGKQIDRVSRNFPGLKSDYVYLSERVHPNALGALLYFSESAETENGSEFCFRSSNDLDQSLRMLITAGQLLALMDHGMCVMERTLSRVEANGKFSMED